MVRRAILRRRRSRLLIYAPRTTWWYRGGGFSKAQTFAHGDFVWIDLVYEEHQTFDFVIVHIAVVFLSRNEAYFRRAGFERHRKHGRSLGRQGRHLARVSFERDSKRECLAIHGQLVAQGFRIAHIDRLQIHRSGFGQIDERTRARCFRHAAREVLAPCAIVSQMGRTGQKFNGRSGWVITAWRGAAARWDGDKKPQADEVFGVTHGLVIAQELVRCQLYSVEVHLGRTTWMCGTQSM